MMIELPLLKKRTTFNHLPASLGYSTLETVTSPAGRMYTTPAGKRYPSITTVLGLRKRGELQAWRHRVGEEEANRISRIASGAGSQVHDLLEKYINNSAEVLTGKEMPQIVLSYRTIQGVLDRALGDVYLQEAPLYSDHLGVGGRVDLIAKFQGKLSIIDFKTSNRAKTENDIIDYFIQESAYAIMFEERTGIPISNLVTIMAVNGSDKPLVFIEKRDNWITELKEAINEYHREKLFSN